VNAYTLQAFSHVVTSSCKDLIAGLLNIRPHHGLQVTCKDLCRPDEPGVRARTRGVSAESLRLLQTLSCYLQQNAKPFTQHGRPCGKLKCQQPQPHQQQQYWPLHHSHHTTSLTTNLTLAPAPPGVPDNRHTSTPGSERPTALEIK
jgi:hypothetical protein